MYLYIYIYIYIYICIYIRIGWIGWIKQHNKSSTVLWVSCFCLYYSNKVLKNKHSNQIHTAL